MGRTAALVSLILWLLGLNTDVVEQREWQGDVAQVKKRRMDMSEKKCVLWIV